MAFSLAMPWHAGETNMQNLMHVPPQENPTASMLTPQASFNLQRNPLLAIGTLDEQGRPWTTLWGGSPGFSQSLGGGLIGTRTVVDGVGDPVVEALLGKKRVEGGREGGEDEMIQPEGGKLLSGLSIDLMTRKRVKIAGRMIAGVVGEVDVEYPDEIAEGETDRPKRQHQIQLVTKIEQSLGNCPKYLNQYSLRPATIPSSSASPSNISSPSSSSPSRIQTNPTLTTPAKSLINRVDMFFLTSTTTSDMDTNHRGGPSGFVRIASDTSIVYPEYSGNRLYQTLGNLSLNPSIGLVFPCYTTGDVLYITGTASILVGPDANAVLPGSNLAVKVEVIEARYVGRGLAFRGELKSGGLSPYNPIVRTLASEGSLKAKTGLSGDGKGEKMVAKLIQKTLITPTIARFTFSVSDPSSKKDGKEGKGIQYKPGQYVTLDFKEHMDIGYSHMRDDDPRSLNDDWVRTFTISSAPATANGANEEQNTFAITIRNLGPVTNHLFQQSRTSFSPFEIPILGIGGDFQIPLSSNNHSILNPNPLPLQQANPHQDPGSANPHPIPFIAGGIGITPLLPHLPFLLSSSSSSSSSNLHLLWTLRLTDLPLVLDTMTLYPSLAPFTRIYFTGSASNPNPNPETSSQIESLKERGVEVYMRRLRQEDIEMPGIETYYLCAGKLLRGQILSWLSGKNVVFEDFDY